MVDTGKVIQEFVDKQVTDKEYEENKSKYTVNTPELKETYFYRKIFETFYPGKGSIIPHFWLPKWCGDKKDPSARELTNYDNQKEINKEI